MAVSNVETNTRADRRTDLRTDLRHDVDALRRDIRHLRRDVSEDVDTLRDDLRDLQRDATREVRQRVEDAPTGVILVGVTAGLGLGAALWNRMRRRARA